MTRLIALLAACLLAAACGQAPRTDTHPSPPPISYAPLRHPLHGKKLYLEADTPARRWQDTHGAGWLEPITAQPQAHWLNGPDDLEAVPGLARDARRQDAMLVLVAYYVPDRGCAGHKDGAPTPEAYAQWIDRLVERLGNTHAVIIMEPDAIPAECYGPERARVLNAAVGKLVGAGQYVYLDAGHPRWRGTGEAAERLLAAGVNRAEGFSVNVANRQSTEDSQRWAVELADLIGNREFVIDTSRNGLGPPPGREQDWCNPERQALGQPPTTTPDQPGTAALLWIKRPGESDGICGGESTYEFSARQARTLIMNSRWVSQAERDRAANASG